MREILFRGKTESGEWVEGFYCPCCFGYFPCLSAIIDKQEMESGCWRPEKVIPETVGEFTGLYDKNGKRIFEGDIVKAQDDVFGSPLCYGIVGKIVYDECAFFIEPSNPMDSQWLYDECAVYEILGNIHDNPELLKGGD